MNIGYVCRSKKVTHNKAKMKMDKETEKLNDKPRSGVPFDPVVIRQYSDKVICDDNFDIEHEKLCEIIGLSHVNDCEFYDCLPDGFTKQEATGREDEPLGFIQFVRAKTMPNKGSDFRQAFSVGEVAHEFKNGFLSIHFEQIL